MSQELLEDPRADSLSPSARRLLRRPRPRYRGILHRWAALASIPAGAVLVIGADGTRSKIACLFFAFGALAMLGTSAVVHWRDWPIERVESLVRFDHAAIFLTYATTATPIALLALDGNIAMWLLATTWVGATVGIILEWAPFHPPAGVVNTIFFGFGGVVPVFSPWLIDGFTLSQGLWFVAGLLTYALGAFIVGARYPDPWTDVFGYHEIWHVFVVVAIGAHYGLVIDLAW
jgi:hemolysin III